MQRTRRTDPYPSSWEIPVGLTIIGLMLLVLGAQVARSLANLLAGNGWHLAHRDDLVITVPAILAGHADAGLTLSDPASPGLLWTCVAVVELVLLVAIIAGVKVGLDRWGPGRIKGMATREEAEKLLGLSRLRASAKVVRPDLYGSRRRVAAR